MSLVMSLVMSLGAFPVAVFDLFDLAIPQKETSMLFLLVLIGFSKLIKGISEVRNGKY